MKRLITVILLFIGLVSNAQHVLKVQKMQTVRGVFCKESDTSKEKEYLYFSEDGSVSIYKTKKNTKKAMSFITKCRVNNLCNDVQTLPYTFENNIIEFSIGGTTYIKLMEGKFEDQGKKIVFKQSETDKIQIIKEFHRVD